ncbi:hypothetical protein [Marinobacter sp. F4206]|uniref:hypothetical protein n=1 Tax=Marinobacter sp. F4206 TaxID=2861777 RepID=UPI001C5E4ACA|nr:hypothetical protein [Marinobacter sp. F4206]MBW4934141.1 hypothetical protein [Marinobacter sp. F4206]
MQFTGPNPEGRIVFKGYRSQTTGHTKEWLIPLAFLLLVALALPRAAPASGDFYLMFRQWQPYDWPEDVPSATEVTRSQRGLGWHRERSEGDVGLDYDYQILGIDNGEPAHNGHLHRLMVGGQWQHRLYRVEARAGLAGTSNMFKYQAFHSDIVTGRVAVFRAVSEGSPLSLGVGGDHRFGSFRWLPRVRWEHTGKRGLWLADLPVLLRWRSHGERWALRLEREGDRWATLDAARTLEGALYLREWRAELTYRIDPGKGLWPAVVLGIGASVNTRLRYQDLNAGTVDRRLGDAIFGSIRLRFGDD